MDTEKIVKVSQPPLLTKVESSNKKPDQVEDLGQADLVSKGNELKEAEKIDQLETVDSENLKEVVKEMNSVLQDERRSIQFVMDNEDGNVIISVIDQKTGEEIKQIPSEEMQQLAKRMAEMAEGKDDFTGMFVSKVV